MVPNTFFSFWGGEEDCYLFRFWRKAQEGLANSSNWFPPTGLSTLKDSQKKAKLDTRTQDVRTEGQELKKGNHSPAVPEGRTQHLPSRSPASLTERLSILGEPATKHKLCPR
uniref:Uncharacterized protein n=1 Tax=Micrurus carvalhoi TaxID=3147026 RepID=A0A2H6MXX8_9SAUR